MLILKISLCIHKHLTAPPLAGMCLPWALVPLLVATTTTITDSTYIALIMDQALFQAHYSYHINAFNTQPPCEAETITPFLQMKKESTEEVSN